MKKKLSAREVFETMHSLLTALQRGDDLGIRIGYTRLAAQGLSNETIMEMMEDFVSFTEAKEQGN